MKKNLLKILAGTGIILSSISTAQANDLNSLTKATVKLIKENRTISKDISDLTEKQSNLENTVNKDKIMIKTLSDENREIRALINQTNIKIDGQINGARDTYNKSANNVSKNTQREYQELLQAYKDMKQEFRTYKLFTDTELNILKGKLAKTDSSSKSNRIIQSSDEEDSILKEFIK